jgi:hypothetical protein
VLAAADDDEIGVALLGQLEQTLGWIAELDDVVGIDAATRESRAGSLKLPPGELVRLRRCRRRLRRRHRRARRDRAGDRHGSKLGYRRWSMCRRANAYNEQPSRERFGKLTSAPKRPLSRIGSVVANDDRLHGSYRPLLWPFCLCCFITVCAATLFSRPR